MQNAFQQFQIEDPASWLALELQAEVPTDTGVWCELVDALGDDHAASSTTTHAIQSCALRFESETIPQGTPLQKLLAMLRDDINLYQVDESAILLVWAGTYPMQGFYLETTNNNNIELCDLFRAPYYALLTSWGKNPNRVHAHKARKFLCNEVEQMLEVEALAKRFIV
ncbi:MAG TPA: hypothetical protein VJI96_01080 [Candidatus Andersenbacteria bacterium]|nr:hypothetical protein [Candidatus Andersenbacteria bacterium]